MALEKGTRLGNYEVLSSLGAGGMGEVYRARDTQLGREVAIKVLPEGFSNDPERMARFEREAKVLASLNHNNIATLYGYEADGETRFLVMEVVEGETLAERIGKGPIPVDQALSIFIQIAEGLEAAHEKGILHRDLKPANVMISDDGHGSAGRVKILDFGLAKAMDGEATFEDDLADSPTLTHDVTRRGVILGTAGYMSPEQVRGEEVDRRTDVWAFGCCLFEALSGEQAFEADTTQGALAKILEREPQWGALPDDLPRILQRLLHRCLEKSHRERLHDIGDARLLLEEAQLSSTGTAESGSAPPLAKRTFVVPAIALGLVLVVAAAWFIGRASSPTNRIPEPVRRMSVNLPEELPLFGVTLGIRIRNMAVSPDGSVLVYVAESEDGGSILVRRRLGEIGIDVLEGTEGAAEPFFSPDGEWVGFNLPDLGIFKVPIVGGAAQRIHESDSPGTFGAAVWAADGSIYFVDQRLGGTLGIQADLMRVGEDGGPAEAVPQQVEIPEGHAVTYLSRLPGDRGLLLSRMIGGLSIDYSRLEVLSLETGEVQVIAEKAMMGRFSGEGPSGHLVYGQAGRMMAVPYDAERLTEMGPHVEVTEPAMRIPAGDLPRRWDLSLSGSLVFAPDDVRTLVLVDRNGTARPLPQAPATRSESVVSVSPDGNRLAIEGADLEIWVYDIERATSTRLTHHPSQDTGPIWGHDGEWVFFASMRGGNRDIYRKRSDGTGDIELLADNEWNLNAASSTADGRSLFYIQYGRPGGGQTDMGRVAVNGSGKLETVLQTEFSENGHLSPDGRWLAYTSDESGRLEVYVRPFPELAPKSIISNGVGKTVLANPVWSRDSREIFYWGSEGTLMSVAVETEPTFSPGAPEALFSGPYEHYFDVLPNGDFVMIQTIGGDHEIVVVENFDEELRRLAPPDAP